MRYNWNPKRVAFLDFETRSPAPLTTVNKYAKDPRTRPLTCVVKLSDTGEYIRCGPSTDPADYEPLMRIAADYVLCAHNAPFDGAIWEHVLRFPEVEWYDTLAPARAAGLPGKLDMLSREIARENGATGKALEDAGKDKRGKMLVDMLCIGNGPFPPFDHPVYGLLLVYNIRDVDLLEQAYYRVRPYGEPLVMDADYAINQRGMPMCRPFLEQMRDLFEANRLDAEEDFTSWTGGINPRSPKQVVAWLESQGFEVDGVGRAAIRELFTKPGEFFIGDGDMAGPLELVRNVLEARQEVVKVGAGKVKAALDGLEEDDRLRDQFVYFGAGPGRWAGRGMQPHNMPLAVKGLDTRTMEPTIENVQRAAAEATDRMGYNVANADVVNSMLRHAVRADNLLVADYNAVEARYLAWFAGRQLSSTMLDVYDDPLGKSIYLDMGAKVFGRTIRKTDVWEYALSKSLVLGCGYGMSGHTFAAAMQKRARTGGAEDMDPNKLVKLYREAYPDIPALWRELGTKCLRCVRYKCNDSAAGGKLKFEWARDGRDLHMVLPSGRPIVYREPEIRQVVPKWAAWAGGEPKAVDTVYYKSAKYGVKYLYGARLVENAVQGTSRDRLAQALVDWESAGFHTCFHVHDEGGAADPPERFDEFMEIMSRPVDWCSDAPILVEGYSGPLWSKNSSGYTEASWFKGRKLK